MQENFSTSRDPFGFEMINVRVSATLNGVIVKDINVRVVKSLYDQYKEMGKDVLEEYLRNLVIEYLMSNVSIIHAIEDRPW